MLSKPKTTGRGRQVRFVVRKQKRNPRRLLESVPEDWERWDTAAKIVNLNWSELTRRALEQFCSQILDDKARRDMAERRKAKG